MHDLTITSHMIDVLATVAQKYHVVIGLYGTFIGDDSHDIAISFKDGTLGEVFDAIVRADPRLEWKQANNGAIDFLFLDTPLSLFDIKVHSFDVEDPQRAQIADSLAQIPEIAGWLRTTLRYVRTDPGSFTKRVGKIRCSRQEYDLLGGIRRNRH